MAYNTSCNIYSLLIPSFDFLQVGRDICKMEEYTMTEHIRVSQPARHKCYPLSQFLLDNGHDSTQEFEGPNSAILKNRNVTNW
jgi:hypothetical protein